MRDVTRTELEFIARDHAELLQLILSVRKNSAVGAISLGLSPFIAFFAEESFNYLLALAHHNSGYALSCYLFEAFSEAVMKLRVRAKLFDDNRGGLEGLVKTLSLAHQKSSEWFLHPHSGFLRELKQRLQPDLGIFYIQEHVMCTTHTALLTLGLTNDGLLTLGPSDMRYLGPLAYEFSYAAGAYLAQMASHLREHGFITETSVSTPRPGHGLPITHNDHYGHLVYTHVSDHLNLTRSELSVAIVFLVAQINFVERVLTYLLVPTSTLLLRARFMTAYHATTALQKLEVLERNSSAYQLGSIAREILNEPDSDFLLGARQIRNVLAHYGLRRAARFLTVDGDPLNDVLTGLCQRGVEDVAATAQRQLSRISEAFVPIISKTALISSRAILGDHT